MDKGDVSKLDTLQRRFCTTNLLHKIPKLSKQLDADPFLKAQDSNIKFLKSLTVSKDLQKESHYIVSYGINPTPYLFLTTHCFNAGSPIILFVSSATSSTTSRTMRSKFVCSTSLFTSLTTGNSAAGAVSPACLMILA